LLALGLIRWVNGYLSRGALDNWTSDRYVWSQEVVLVTGGAGGIGGNVVKLLGEKGIKVVVLDVIPMTFAARKSFNPCIPIVEVIYRSKTPS
jgi:all-trans-retinol dehydrogenase (NAD+)